MGGNSLMSLRMLAEYVYYDDGVLRWKVNRSTWIKPGDIVGCQRKDGYWEAQIVGERWLVHRAIFLLHHGYLPKLIDHIDRNPSNNKIENLRAANKRINALNAGLASNNTSGVKGVSWDRTKDKWVARHKHDGHYKCVGYFNNKLSAAAALWQYKEGLK